MSSIYRLFDPHTQAIAAECTLQDGAPFQVTVDNTWFKAISEGSGIPLPPRLSDRQTKRICKEDDPELFAKAFFAAFPKGGPYRKANWDEERRNCYYAKSHCYWVKKEEYKGPKGEDQKAIKWVLEARKASRETHKTKKVPDTTLSRNQPPAKKPRIAPPDEKENTLPPTES